MPTFDTPKPILASVEMDGAVVRFLAEDRRDTVVGVQPVDRSRDLDVRIARQTKVSFADGQLRVKAPKQYPVFSRGGNVEITIALPADSQIEASVNWGDLVAEGRLGECRVKAASGSIHMDEAGPVWLTANSGDITVGRAVGHTEAATSSGNLRFHSIDGPAVLKNTHGATTVTDVTGSLTVIGATGDITVERAHASVSAKATHGRLRIGEVARGTVVLESSTGSIEIGVREGTGAYLNVSSTDGRVHNTLAATEAPGDAEDTVEVRARTKYGQIDIRRARSTYPN
ncbi:DUF4097 domain-containing protein [Streptomyces sp. NPDC058755]|uniref:DUF4097 family beta strand repeat-containing protein n=1 Tax=unclassified Streptomyces TaxID=2593676 RepID=UPI00367BEE09